MAKLERRPGQTALPIEPPVVYGAEGSYVDLVERAEPLIMALDAVSERNKRQPGFDVASKTKSYNRPIKERYGSALPAVQLGAADNARVYETETKRYLWKASGYTALRSVRPRLASNREIDARGKKMWRDFDATIGHTSHVLDRVRLRRQLVRTIERFYDYHAEEAA